MPQDESSSDSVLEDLITAIQQLSSQEKTHSQVFKEFSGLFNCIGKDTSTFEVKSKFHHLLFNPNQPTGLSDKQLQTVFHQPVENMREKHLAKFSGPRNNVIGIGGFKMDLSSVAHTQAYPEFDLLCQQQEVLVPNLTGRSERPRELDVWVNLAIALTTRACRVGAGMVSTELDPSLTLCSAR